MAAPCQSVCTPWADTSDLCSICDDYAFDQALLEDKIAVASDLLFEWSARRFPGSCSDVVRPCARDGSRSWGRTLAGRRVLGGCGCHSSDACGCSRLSQVGLGVSPVTDVTEVKVDGVVLDPSLYRVDDWRWLVRLADADGTNPGWPCCQDLLAGDDEEGSFVVAVTYTLAPPAAGVAAAAALACQLALACQPETVGECRLPRGVTQITRQDVSITVLSAAMVEEVKAALPEVAMFLDAYNPGGVARRAVVASPDVGRRVRRVST